MSQVCRQCSRVNPADAAYCYFDGTVLASHAGSGPVNAGSAPFPSPFVFPTGQACKNFDQLALACHQNWQAALDMLRQGFLGTFFGGLGRADLAIAATEATRFPDVDRGLDQLLGKLPTHVLQNPQLKAEPTAINLGELPMGTDRESEIHLSNLGMRLLYGSVSSDCKWLTLGEGPASGQKLFQFAAEAVIPIHVKGQFLRAGTKPLEGHLLVDSNGGTATITFRADVPIKPFPGGLFDGCKTPRQVAEKAKANPKAAAPYFENGAVAQWFASNGWTYPVQGPPASGLGGVQQFFEALGLAKAPKVTLNTQSLSFHGDGGQSLQATIEVSSPEKKPVYAHATCDQPWVDCSNVKLAGRKATITVAIPRVPDRPNETLQATVKVIGNGNQTFRVPLLLTIDKPDPNPPPVVEIAPEPVELVPEPFAAPATHTPFADLVTASPPVLLPTGPPPLPTSAIAAEPMLVGSPAAPTGPANRPAPPRRRSGKPIWLHLTPLALLAVALLGVMIWDFAFGPATAHSGDDVVDPTLYVVPYFDWADVKTEGISNTMSFGLTTVDPSNPKRTGKRLTFATRGGTNSSLLLIDGREREFGSLKYGKWEDRPTSHGNHGKSATFLFTGEQIFATQRVEIVPGEAIEVTPEVYRRLLDTCLVRYTIKNRDTRAHKVGFRFVLDTLIGANDGCPFTIPGSDKLVSTQEDFNPAKNKKPVPDFVQALEFQDLRNPGTIAQVNFKISDKLEPPGRVSLTQWPGMDYLRKFEIPVKNIDLDSAVVMYWPPADLPPGKAREIGFSYGLGNLGRETEKIGLTFGGSFFVGGQISAVALIAEVQQGESATLQLPNGLTLLEGSPSQGVVPSTEKTADGRLRPSPVSWRIRADRDGVFPVTVRTNRGLEATRRITIKKSSIF